MEVSATVGLVYFQPCLQLKKTPKIAQLKMGFKI